MDTNTDASSTLNTPKYYLNINYSYITETLSKINNILTNAQLESISLTEQELKKIKGDIEKCSFRLFELMQNNENYIIDNSILRYIIKTRHIFLNLVNMQKNTYIANNNLF
ncbi:MAG: hypothetical protein LBD88_04115 [Candidatus Peribacteria bacterium]|jgi:hypothetical protein|nr:hypothetical protein [Candidatus Peribacteria bacterium]